MSLFESLSRAQIAQMIPHGAAMCMLDRVVSWNETHIECESLRLADINNPLCEAGQLESVLLIEYAAQAAAVHAVLSQAQFGKASGEREKPAAAYIGAVKNIELLEPLIFNEPLRIYGECLMQSEGGAIYNFHVQQAALCLIRGKIVLSQT